MDFSDLVPSDSSISTKSAIRKCSTSKTDFYVTRHQSKTATVLSIINCINKYGQATLHAVGAANYHALKLAVMVQKQRTLPSTFTVSTETISTHDFKRSIGSSDIKASERNINAVHILIQNSPN